MLKRTSSIDLYLPKLHYAQEQVKDNATRFCVVDCGRRFGKTLLGVDLAIEPAIRQYPVGWFSPTYKMLLEVWRDMRSVLAPITQRSNAQERRIELLTGGLVEMWSLDNVDAGRGRKYKRVVIDEAAMVANLKEAWEKSIRPTLTDYRGDAFFLSTPKGRNYYWQMYQWGIDPEYPQWSSWQFPTSANPYISDDEIEEARQMLPELTFQQEYLAEFIENEGAVFRNIQACMNAEPQKIDDHAKHRITVGVDWGKQADFTAISLGCADCKIELAIDRFNKIDYAFQRQRLEELAKKWNATQVLAESNAMGEPVIEELQRSGLPVRGFQTTASSKPQLIENLALTLEREEWQFIAEPIWTAELEAYEQKVNPNTGRSSYSAPEGLHDDTVIARALMVREAQRWFFA